MIILLSVVALICLKGAAQLWLERLNNRNGLAHAGAVPEPFKSVVDEVTYRKSVEYTLAKGRLDQVEITYNAAVLLAVLLSGVLPWEYHWFTERLGGSAWAMAAFLLATGVALSLPGLPL